jgi:hypothetical protein
MTESKIAPTAVLLQQLQDQGLAASVSSRTSSASNTLDNLADLCPGVKRELLDRVLVQNGM